MIPDDEIRRLRETQVVLLQLLQRLVMFDALKTDTEDSLNFFRIYKGCLFDGIVIDWWKVFGNRNDDCHWKQLLPAVEHQEIRREMDALLDNDLDSVWTEFQNFRNNYSAHLNFDQNARPKRFPKLTPLRLTAEIIYRRIFERLNDQDRASGLISPAGMIGEPREKIKDHWGSMADYARKKLADWKNYP